MFREISRDKLVRATTIFVLVIIVALMLVFFTGAGEIFHPPNNDRVEYNTIPVEDSNGNMDVVFFVESMGNADNIEFEVVSDDSRPTKTITTEGNNIRFSNLEKTDTIRVTKNTNNKQYILDSFEVHMIFE
jgi:hypothetical protein